MPADNSILIQARTWLGTPFKHQGRVKGIGCDCIGLVVGVLRELSVVSHQLSGVMSGECCIIGEEVENRKWKLENRKSSNHSSLIIHHYLHQYDHLNYGRIPDGNMLKETLSRLLREVSPNEIKPGDIALFRFDKNPQHVGIISDYPVVSEQLPVISEKLSGNRQLIADHSLGIIHCYAQARKVVEHRLDEIWMERLVSLYRITNLRFAAAHHELANNPHP